MAARGWISRDPVGRPYSGSSRRVSREGVRQQGTQMGAPGIDFGREFAIGSPSVQLPDSAVEKWGGLAPTQDPFGSQAPSMLDADPQIARTGERYSQSAANYEGTDSEMAFSGAGPQPITLNGPVDGSNPPEPPAVDTAATDFDAPLRADFSEFNDIEGGRMGKALGGAQDAWIAENADANYVPDDDEGGDMWDLDEPAVNPQEFLTDQLRNRGTGRDGNPGDGTYGDLMPSNPPWWSS